MNIFCLYCSKCNKNCVTECSFKLEIEKYKDNPIAFIEKILNVKLMDYQKQLLTKIINL